MPLLRQIESLSRHAKTEPFYTLVSFPYESVTVLLLADKGDIAMSQSCELMNGLSHCYNFVYADGNHISLFRKPDGVDTDDWHTELF